MCLSENFPLWRSLSSQTFTDLSKHQHENPHHPHRGHVERAAACCGAAPCVEPAAERRQARPHVPVPLRGHQRAGDPLALGALQSPGAGVRGAAALAGVAGLRAAVCRPDRARAARALHRPHRCHRLQGPRRGHWLGMVLHQSVAGPFGGHAGAIESCGRCAGRRDRRQGGATRRHLSASQTPAGRQHRHRLLRRARLRGPQRPRGGRNGPFGRPKGGSQYD